MMPVTGADSPRDAQAPATTLVPDAPIRPGAPDRPLPADTTRLIEPEAPFVLYGRCGYIPRSRIDQH